MSSTRRLVEADAVPLSGRPENAVVRIRQRPGGEWVIYSRRGSLTIKNEDFCHQMESVARRLFGEGHDALTRAEFMRVRRAAAQGLAQLAADIVHSAKKGAPRGSP